MSASLVGSEMCIRDRRKVAQVLLLILHREADGPASRLPLEVGVAALPVSYTHLTLPTICSV
eukprot:12882514-Alexandrium_andersonii.AAC.1